MMLFESFSETCGEAAGFIPFDVISYLLHQILKIVLTAAVPLVLNDQHILN